MNYERERNERRRRSRARSRLASRLARAARFWGDEIEIYLDLGEAVMRR